ncbi:LytTR family DNA-binding domain-containing protein [Flavobacteriaceae bacterium S356]|uniref:LytTR family DNA-binding domain-containing protein n=1 Tax=Asprobacillus argus TaxID=3076534 RepID=A0ABU3LDN6_9FLAO|nr:LytTR family DNA-binding domain-containing protein [Flavobacteriaceae bacterium S356]
MIDTHTSNPSVKCIIIDDEPLAIKLIKGHIEQVPGLELVATYQNAVTALDLLKKESIDLIFLDIEMPVLTGIDFVKSLQKPPGIIFTTAYRNYAAESYELNVIDYLIKPITFTRFFKAVNKFFNQHNQAQTISQEPSSVPTPQNYIYVNSNKKHIKIEFDQMLYIESIKDYVRIHTADKSIVTKDKISDFEQKVPSHFLRVHRSFIVNTHKITAFTKQDIEINEREIPIGRNYKSLVLKLLE